LIIMPVSEITPAAVKLDKLVHRIEEGDIKIPAFQRGFVWTQQQVIQLLDSVYRDYPIGSVLLWNSHERLKSSRQVCGFQLPDRDESYPVNYVLDGQQRLSTIFAVFCGNNIERASDLSYEIDMAVFDVWFDLDDDKFAGSDDLNPNKKYLKLRGLFDVSAFVESLKGLDNVQSEKAKRVYSKFNNYEIPVVTITKRDKTEVGIVFERINSTGTSLTTIDLMVAWSWSEDFHLREQIDLLLEKLDEKNFGDIPEKIILQSLAGALSESTTTKAILELNPDSVRENFQKLFNAFEKTIDFLSTNLYVCNRDFLPHLQQLVPLSYFFFFENRASAEQIKLLKSWFWRTSFSRRYAAQTDEKMDVDLKFIKELRQGRGRIDHYNYSITQDLLLNQRFIKSSPLVRAVLLLLAQSKPKDLTNGGEVDLNKALSKYNSKEYHHIFPKNFLKNRGITADRINQLCNFSILPASSNKLISDRAPSDYFYTLTPKAHLSEILDSNLITLNQEILKKDNYEEFLKSRAQLILQHLDRLIVA
jgi:hypothetical protein